LFDLYTRSIQSEKQNERDQIIARDCEELGDMGSAARFKDQQDEITMNMDMMTARKSAARRQ